jgi:tetratricopeptide (TPR) repeat protein
MASEDIGGLESLQVLLQQNPNSLTFGRVADALMTLGRIDEAIQLCEDGLRRHPSYVTGHMVLGKCYLKKKLFDQAEKEFKRVLLFDPKYLAAHKYYGDLMREIGWDNTCEMNYRKILQIDPLDRGVRAVVEELAQKGKSEKSEPASIRREAAPAAEPPPSRITVKPVEPAIPPPSDDLFSAADGENDLLRYQPAAEAADVFPLGFDTTSDAPDSIPSTPAPPDADDERFSYILDDIFQDEAIGEKPVVPVPDNKIPLAPPNSRRDAEVNSHDGMKFSERPDLRYDRELGATSDEAEQTARPASKTPTRPVEFDLDFDDMPPAASADLEKASGFDFEAAEPEEQIPPARPNSRPAVPSRLPARRPRLLDDTHDEPMPIASASEREKIVTPTLGEIYAAQGQYTKAIGVFELLSKKEPNNKHYREKIDYLKKRLQETQNAG